MERNYLAMRKNSTIPEVCNSSEIRNAMLCGEHLTHLGLDKAHSLIMEYHLLTEDHFPRTENHSLTSESHLLTLTNHLLTSESHLLTLTNHLLTSESHLLTLTNHLLTSESRSLRTENDLLMLEDHSSSTEDHSPKQNYQVVHSYGIATTCPDHSLGNTRLSALRQRGFTEEKKKYSVHSPPTGQAGMFLWPGNGSFPSLSHVLAVKTHLWQKNPGTDFN